jgi:hypothetical protein
MRTVMARMYIAICFSVKSAILPQECMYEFCFAFIANSHYYHEN